MEEKLNKSGRPRFSEANVIGKKFNRLTVMEISRTVDGSGKKYIYCKCVCECGVVKDYLYRNIESGSTKSCGCLSHSMNGMSKSPEFSCYYAMISRCYRKASAHTAPMGRRE